MSCLSEEMTLLTLTPGTDKGFAAGGDIFWHRSLKWKKEERKKDQENEREVTNGFQ